MKPDKLFLQVNIVIWMVTGLIPSALIPIALIPSAVGQQKQPTPGEKLFALHVQPLFQKKCIGCHGEKPDEIEGGFDLRSRASLLQGGDSFAGKVVIPGDAIKSHLVAIVSRKEDGFEMPPKEADRLSKEEIWSIENWIKGGSPWPDPQQVARIYQDHAEGIPWKTGGGLTTEWTNRKYKESNLWSYQPLLSSKVTIPENLQTNPIDFFIDRKLKAAKLETAPLANRGTLVRRATFDLLGLPPSPTQVDRFLNDPQDDEKAFADLVERLLHSRHYGEQWGRHWLDVVRYADSSGFANDYERPNAWRYRDYVIRAFNNDKPYDQFVKEQIAGDEMALQLNEPDPMKNQAAAELLIAAGFLRMGPWEQTGMSVARVTRQQFLDDVTDSVGQVFLAHALQCCRCHDHKFDPVATRDYYSIQSVFSTTQFAEINTAWLDDENRKFMEKDWAYHSKKLSAIQGLIGSLQQRNKRYIQQWFQSKGLPYQSVAEAQKANLPNNQLPPRKYGWTPDDYGQERVTRKWNTRLTWEKDRYLPVAYTVYNGKTVLKRNYQGRVFKPANPLAQGLLEQTAILEGGDIGSPSEKVLPGILTAAGVSHPIPQAHDGRRTAFAQWLVSREHPITARVMVNRIWQYHFGKGLAGNANNFGSTGKKPTHPHLLDWLAGEFMRRGWSIKKLHRLIMSSHAYRRSLFHPLESKRKEIDPANKLYAVFQQRQLSSEEIRDAMLAVTGELNPEIGGIPGRPDINMEAALQPRMIMGTFAPAYVPNPNPRQRNRRSIYALRLRGHRDPFMELFNQPGSEKSCELRDQSMVAPQALSLLNGNESNDRSLALAIRAMRESGSDTQVIQRIYRLTFGRIPSEKELSGAITAWKQMTAIESRIQYKPRVYPTKVTRTANEENTGKLFSFVEPLIEYNDYQPDPQPHQFDAKTRGLANFCLAIFNSNEFMFID